MPCQARVDKIARMNGVAEDAAAAQAAVQLQCEEKIAQLALVVSKHVPVAGAWQGLDAVDC